MLALAMTLRIILIPPRPKEKRLFQLHCTNRLIGRVSILFSFPASAGPTHLLTPCSMSFPPREAFSRMTFKDDIQRRFFPEFATSWRPHLASHS